MKRIITTKVILHCSATKNEKIRVTDIRRFQTAKDFPGGPLPDVAYHYFIGSDGLLELGLPESERGYHTKLQNYCSIAICLNGPTDGKWPNDNQLFTLDSLLLYLVSAYPMATLHGHHEFRADKTCPAFDYSGLVAKWQENASRILAGRVLDNTGPPNKLALN